MNKAVFLDRDGTIVEDTGYLNHPVQVRFLPGAVDAVKKLNEAGYKVIVITNQSGVARGLFSEDMLQTIDKHVQKAILNGGAHLDGIYYCPHHPEHGVYPYKQACECRKPHPGLIKKAAKELAIDLASSFMVGDHNTDITAGQRAGVKTILITTGRGKEEKGELKSPPEHFAPDLLSAARWILENSSTHT